MAREYDQEKAMENLEIEPEWCEKIKNPFAYNY